jgi:hypothetical protein
VVRQQRFDNPELMEAGKPRYFFPGFFDQLEANFIIKKNDNSHTRPDNHFQQIRSVEVIVYVLKTRT